MVYAHCAGDGVVIRRSVGVYSFVQAQATGSKTVTTAVDGTVVNEFDRTFERIYGSTGIAD